MINIYSLLDLKEEEKLEKLYKSKNLHQFYSVFENEYSKTLNFSIKNLDAHNNYYLKKHAQNFVDISISINLKKPSDILVCITEFDKTSILIFLEIIFKSEFVDKFLMISLYTNPKVISKLPYGDWIEIIGREYLKYRLTSTADLLEIENLFVADIEYSNLYKEYMLSWSYEENRLSLKAEKYFETNFYKKYLQLKELRNK